MLATAFTFSCMMFQGDPVFVPIKFDRMKTESIESMSEAEGSPGVYDRLNHSTSGAWMLLHL